MGFQLSGQTGPFLALMTENFRNFAKVSLFSGWFFFIGKITQKKIYKVFAHCSDCTKKLNNIKDDKKVNFGSEIKIRKKNIYSNVTLTPADGRWR
mgnify:CR=1 FL=1